MRKAASLRAPCFTAAVPTPPPDPLRYLAGYPEQLRLEARALLDAGKLGELVRSRNAEKHEIRNDGALLEYTMELKQRFLRSSPPLAKVSYDNKIHVVQHALGTHTRVSRVQGGRLKATREIRVASSFRDGPASFLRMIVVHELAHLRESEHDRAFYQLCCHMEPSYHRLELDCRLLMTAEDVERADGCLKP